MSNDKEMTAEEELKENITVLTTESGCPEIGEALFLVFMQWHKSECKKWALEQVEKSENEFERSNYGLTLIDVLTKNIEANND